MLKRETHIYSAHLKKDSDLPAIVFVHGDLQNHTSFLKMSKFFEQKGHSMVFLDLPGHGLSEVFSENLEKILEDIINKYNLTNPILIGHSAGGILAANYAQKNSNISGLLLINACLGNPIIINDIKDYENVKKYYLTASKSLFEKQEAVDYSKIIDFTEDEITKLGFKTTSISGFENNINYYTSLPKNDKMFDIKVPTLLIVSKNDQIISLEHAKDCENKIPNVRLKIVEEGHNPHLTRSEEIIKIIRENYDFLLGQKAL